MQNTQTYKIEVNGKTNIQLINEVLKFRSKKFNANVNYKQTQKDFKSKYKIDLVGAPIIFVKNSIIWKLCYSTYKSSVSGKICEYAYYLPIASCKDKFHALLREDIKVY